MAKIKAEAAKAAMDGATLKTTDVLTTASKPQRGRPPKPEGDTIYKRITINCTKDEYEAIEAKAEALGELTPGIEYNPTMLTKIAIMQYVKN
jgi:hypothetical protein